MWNMFKVNNKDTRTTPMYDNTFHILFYTVNFEHVIVGQVVVSKYIETYLKKLF